jgi:hypothetical protein
MDICLWSGPRNVSTAMMYSFARRPDTTVIDEPLYGHYLRVTGADHPGRDEVIAAMDCDGDRVMRALLDPNVSRSRPVLFMKHMAHHLVGIDREFLDRVVNVLLIRDPIDMLPSLMRQIPRATLADTGLRTQWQLLEEIRTRGQQPVVIDSRQLLLNPETVLQQLCDRIGLPFAESMLSWPAGGNPADGVWARHWYHAVHKSSGFSPYRPKKSFPTHLLGLLAECRPWYEKLYAEALRADKP